MISVKDLKYLTDENIDVELLEFLREQGFDVFDIKEAGYCKLTREAPAKGLEEAGDRVLEIQRIYVDDRFQKLGLGKFMLQKTLEIVQASNYQWDLVGGLGKQPQGYRLVPITRFRGIWRTHVLDGG